jgi:hypothetical protein
MSVTEHELKCYPVPFAALVDGSKRHEVRKFDRPFAVGDVLLLREYMPPAVAGPGDYTGRVLRLRITHITLPGTFGLPGDTGVMSVEPVPEKGARDLVDVVRRALLAGKEVGVQVRNPRVRR